MNNNYLNNEKKELNKKYAIYLKDSLKSIKLKELIINKLGKDNLDYENPDYVFSIGGDGTYLKAVHNYINNNLDNITFININTGNLGFYSNLDESDCENLIDDLLDHQEYVYHDLIEFKINNKDISKYAVNEICLYGFPEAVKIDCYVDSKLFENFSGSGLVISTPTGSTGLNKSLNGAIIDEKLKTLQISEIAGINNRFYNSLGVSTVLDSKRIVDLVINSDLPIKLSYDNIDFKIDEKIKNIHISYSEKRVKNLKYKHKDFFERVRNSFLV